MLREAFAADLPEFVFKRRKMGFAVPIGEWFRGELRPMLRDHLFAADSFARQHFDMATVERLVEEHEQSRVDHSQRLYALLMLELWHHIQKPRP
jgi:asparagine synthase (glutamine-hydrolysing)